MSEILAGDGESPFALSFGRPNDLTRAFFHALITGGAFVVIDDGMHRFHFDRTRLADTLAKLASETAYVAVGADGRALIYRHTADPMARAEGDEADEVFGASGGTYTATDTKQVVYDGDSVYDLYCAAGAGGDATAETDASVGTELISTADPCGGVTVANTLIYVFFLCELARTRAHYLSAQTNDVRGRFYTHYTGDSRGYLCTADGTAGHGGFALYDRFSIRRASGISATAAVCTGQMLCYFGDTLVYLDGKKLRGDREKKSEHSAKQSKPQKGDQHFHFNNRSF